MANKENLTENLNAALEIAQQITMEKNASYIGSEHLVYAFLRLAKGAAFGVLAGEGVTLSEYESVFFRTIDVSMTVEGMTPRTKRMFQRAMALCIQEYGV